MFEVGTNVVYGQCGVCRVERVGPLENGVMTVAFGAGIKKFPYPAAFERFLTALDPAAQTIALDRVTELGADRQTDSVFLRAVSAAVDDQIPVRAGIALCVEPAKDVIEFQSA